VLPHGLFVLLNSHFVLGQPTLMAPNGLLNCLVVQRCISSLAIE
jgi:hypothetical protein